MISLAHHLSSPEHYASLLDRYDTWMFDCDGVLWHGDHLIDGAVEVLHMLRRKNKKVIFVTNNSRKSRRTLQKKFAKIGVQARLDEIYGAAYVTAIYISSILKLPKTQKVYVIGMEGLEEELAEEGISFVGGTDPSDCTTAPFSLSTFTPDPAVSAVVCGLDTAITYTKLSKALYYLSLPDCDFVAANTYATSEGLLPAVGATVAALRCASGRDPVCAGKPGLMMLECVKAKIPYEAARTIMVGDRLDADIAFGKEGGLATLLVLTGIAAESDISGPNASSIIPDYVTGSLADFRVVEPELEE